MGRSRAAAQRRFRIADRSDSVDGRHGDVGGERRRRGGNAAVSDRRARGCGRHAAVEVAAPASAATDLTKVRGVRRRHSHRSGLTTADARRASALRYVSLPRLEREIAAAAEGARAARAVDADARRLAARAIRVRVSGVGRHRAGRPGRRLESRCEWPHRVDRYAQPVVRLDDLLVLLRRGAEAADSHFGCSINPRQEALAKTQAFLASSSQKPLEPGQRKKWLGDLRDTVGKQDIEIFGVDPASRVAQRAGRGRLSHEAGRHGAGRRRGRRRELSGVDSPGGRASRRRRCRCCGGGLR